MIKATGTIILPDGVSELNSPEINVYFCSPSKLKGAYGVAQACQPHPTVPNELLLVGIGGEDMSWKVTTPNPTFEQVQDVVLTKLQEKYPDVKFEIV